MQPHVADAERTGAEAGDVAAGLERIGGALRAVEDFQPVAAGIAEHDQVRNVPLAGERARAARDLGPGRFDARRYLVESGGVSDPPAPERGTPAAIRVADPALVAGLPTESQTPSGPSPCAP